MGLGVYALLESAARREEDRTGQSCPRIQPQLESSAAGSLRALKHELGHRQCLLFLPHAHELLTSDCFDLSGWTDSRSVSQERQSLFGPGQVCR